MKSQPIMIWLTGLMLLSAACSESPSTAPTIAPGVVLYWLHDSTSFHDIHALFDSMNLKITTAYDYEYARRTPSDSIEAITDVLRAKQYLSNQSGNSTFTASYSDDTLHLRTNFYDLDSLEALDWLATVELLKLEERLRGDPLRRPQHGILEVPVGQEAYWADELQKQRIIKGASVDHIQTGI